MLSAGKNIEKTFANENGPGVNRDRFVVLVAQGWATQLPLRSIRQMAGIM